MTYFWISGADSYVGVRYITEALIKKITKQDNLTLVHSLNLSLSKDGGKKFRVGFQQFLNINIDFIFLCLKPARIFFKNVFYFFL